MYAATGCLGRGERNPVQTLRNFGGGLAPPLKSGGLLIRLFVFTYQPCKFCKPITLVPTKLVTCIVQ